MNLSKRALLVILPIIFLSYCIAAVSVYFSLENSVKRAEQNSLDLALTELTSSFNQYTTFAESYLHALQESGAFRHLLSEEDDIYRHVALNAAIEKSIRGFKQHQSEKFSFLIVRPFPELKELFYFELSEDPFAPLDQSLREDYLSVLSKKAVNDWRYIEGADGVKPAIVISNLVDRSTYSEPIVNQYDNSVLVQLALEPSLFLAARKNIEQRFEATVKVGSSFDPSKVGLISTAKIGLNKTISVAVSKYYLSERLWAIKLVLTGSTLLFFVLSSLLIYRLVHKYITRPISQLEHELTDVVTKRKVNISVDNAQNDEVGRLQRTFHKLYGDLSAAYVKTKRLAERDSLTNLYNLSYVTSFANQAIYDANDANKSVSFLYIDLDNFKYVNDKYGHDVGDALLKVFSENLTRIVKDSEERVLAINPDVNIIHGRVAGDEFSVMVAHIDGETVPSEIANKVLLMFQDGFLWEGGAISVSLSLGMAMYPRDGSTLTEIVSNAKNAMAQAKMSDQSQLALYSKELAASMRRQVDIEQALATMDPDQEFFLVYMPLVNAQTRKIEGFEVLLRWVSSKLGFVGPDEFVPIAEAKGLFHMVDQWVVTNAIKFYAELRQRLGYDFKLSVNLSSAQLNETKIVGTLLNASKKYDVSPNFIQLEMTETLNVEYTEKADALLNVLKDLGFQIAIDDFGTGHTALLQLVEYPAQMIKFDKAFFDKAMLPENRKMLEPLIKLCHSQGLKVTVEGVETQEMADYLQSISCDFLQGYYFGKPATMNELKLD
jgi:diguanylate cyclase (GGDEF)-like protein